MRLAVISDSHDHVWNTRKAIEQANRLGVQLMIHCGDMVSPFMLEEFDRFNGRLHLILGNNPGDQILLMKSVLSRSDRVEFHGCFGRVEVLGMSIAFIHDPLEAGHIARSGDFRLVCFGHTHRWFMEDMGGTLLLNPGEILGRKEQPGWALVEISDAGNVDDIRPFRIERIFVDGSV
ncbi:MAG: YfcE family phosphodiesterase [Dissulfurimicrobium sp.]|uniref:YfcE family phosphodiesterase n=1 Tax=Dissulfurimicrobium hydrothermale TaxID=1750598 RepID=UPI001EDC5855|nr:YfcE family phosphodiesterase [Dissulfurimicrobium hydrothermale]UKL12870.1 YfcE family phosphodiesterase [Dissulfurimicrobium hydrothermale]